MFLEYFCPVFQYSNLSFEWHNIFKYMAANMFLLTYSLKKKDNFTQRAIAF